MLQLPSTYQDLRQPHITLKCPPLSKQTRPILHLHLCTRPALTVLALAPRRHRRPLPLGAAAQLGQAHQVAFRGLAPAVAQVRHRFLWRRSWRTDGRTVGARGYSAGDRKWLVSSKNGSSSDARSPR